MKCQAYPSEAALAAALGRTILDTIRRLPGLVLGLPTGRTPLALYGELVRLSAQDQVDWSEVRTFNLDEFVGLAPGAPGSYRAFMQERLFRHVDIRHEHIGFLDGAASDVTAECRRYERAIAAAGGIDLLVLGIGGNGHIGFNEPAEALVARTHLVTLDAPTRAANALWFDGDVSRVPQHALTMGMATILAARAIVLMATGEAKAEAVRAMLYGGVTTNVPASFLQLHPQVQVMLDQSLADQLP
ncbi:MAG TPA: glucosamine-6-phosphate deaminase [Vicinamibacterales bacterium]|nr:glucosamine-6-phosphate deaminase [Vicinamibacterales bacterium]